MDKHLEQELSKWMPRLSGSAFKCLRLIFLELAAAAANETIIPRKQFQDKTGLSKSSIQTALPELVNAKACVRRPTRGGAFAYSIPGLDFTAHENDQGQKQGGVENKAGSKNDRGQTSAPRPKDLFDVFLWFWQKEFPEWQIPRISNDAKAEINSLLQRYSYKNLRQSQKGLSTLDDAEAIEKALNPETVIAAVRRGNFLYFNWRDARKEEV